MTKKELVQKTKEALDKQAKLPPEVIIQQLIKRGTINAKGEVLMGTKKPKK